MLDGIRGYLLVAMYLAHFCIEMRELGLKSWLNVLRHSHWLPIGEIEFFLPLSGFVVALAYHSVHARHGQRGIWPAVGRRLRWVYGYQVAATLLLVALVQAGVSGVDLRHPGADPAWLLALKSFSLAVLPKYLDILVLNLALLPFVPTAFALLGKGKTWQFWVALVLAWSIAQAGLDRQLSAIVVGTGFNWHRWIGLMGHFSPLSFAILFFGGFSIGFRYKVDRALFETGAMRPRAGIAATAPFVILAYVAAHRFPAWQAFVRAGSGLLSVHAIILTVTAYYIVYWLLAASALRGVVGTIGNGLRAVLTSKPLLFLGANSLFVYACHVIVVALAKATMMSAVDNGAILGQLAMLALFAVGLVIIFAATALKRRYLPSAS